MYFNQEDLANAYKLGYKEANNFVDYYDSAEIQEAFILGYKDASNLETYYSQQDIEEAFNTGYKQASFTLAALGTAAGKAGIAHVGQNILADYGLRKSKTVHKALNNWFQSGLQKKMPSKTTQFFTNLGGVVAPEITIAAKHLNHAAGEFVDHLKKNNITPNKQHYDALKTVLSGDMNKINEINKTHPHIMGAVTGAFKQSKHPLLQKGGVVLEHSFKNPEKTKEVIDAYKKTSFSKFLPAAVEYNPNVVTAAPSKLGLVAEGAANVAIGSHDPLVAASNVSKRILTSPELLQKHPFLAKTQKSIADVVVNNPLKKIRGFVNRYSPNPSKGETAVKKYLLNPVTGDAKNLAHAVTKFEDTIPKYQKSIYSIPYQNSTTTSAFNNSVNTIQNAKPVSKAENWFSKMTKKSPTPATGKALPEGVSYVNRQPSAERWRAIQEKINQNKKGLA